MNYESQIFIKFYPRKLCGFVIKAKNMRFSFLYIGFSDFLGKISVTIFLENFHLRFEHRRGLFLTAFLHGLLLVNLFRRL